MKKVLLRLFIVFCLLTSMLLVAPFHIVHADTSVDYDDVIEGVYYSNGVQSPKQFTWVFNQPVIGYFEPQISYKTSNNSSTATHTPTVYVNGTTATYMMSTGTDIIVQSVTNTFDMLDDASSFSQYTFPIESVTAVMSLVSNGHSITEMNNVGYYEYPTFSLPATNSSHTNAILSRFTLNPANAKSNEYIMIFGINKNVYNQSSLTTNVYYDITSGTQCSMDWIETLYRNNLAPFSVVKVKFSFDDSVSSSDPVSNVRVYTQNSCQITPIYFNYSSALNLGVDFALQFNLQNELILALQQIVGNQNSDNSASDLENEQSEFSSSAAELYEYENDFNESLNDSLDDINVNFDIGNTFGSKFLASATWVRQQFDALTSSSPFGSVLSFSLVLGIALLVIGKAVK